MKKLFIITIICCIAGAGSMWAYEWFKGRQPVRVENVQSTYNVHEFYYKGHEYIHFTARGSYGDAGIVHNPDCRSCRRR